MHLFNFKFNIRYILIAEAALFGGNYTYLNGP